MHITLADEFLPNKGFRSLCVNISQPGFSAWASEVSVESVKETDG